MLDEKPLLAELLNRNVEPATARQIAAVAAHAHSPRAAWAQLINHLLVPKIDFAVHEWLYEEIYKGQTDRPAWFPSDDVVARANVTAAARELGLKDYPSLHEWSVRNRAECWRYAIDRLDIRLRQPFTRVMDASHPTSPRWLVGSSLNIVESCFTADDNAVAVIESDDGGNLRRYTYAELRGMTARVANGLLARGVLPGDAVAVVMPMSFQSVAIYLGVISIGATAISIADSFAAGEISVRLRLAGARMVITQDVVRWGTKCLPLYEKITAANAPVTMVLSSGDAAPNLRRGDLHFQEFLSDDDAFTPVARSPGDPINILFSSGTTGDPKVIPWDHTTPIKCAADAHFHQDLHPGDIACWPTSLGWMMGPWLIFASLINRATIAIYTQAPTDAGFGRFVQDARVTMLGLVPSLVRAWRQSRCMHGMDWSAIRAFSSSGECSNPSDMLYLMHLAGYRSIIEYCGGTEIGGGYVTGTVVQPCTPSTFTTPALGLDLLLLDDEQRPASKGEVFLIGPSIGLSTRLLNRDHDAVYFANTPPGPDGNPLRRHGDELESVPGGGYRVAGRSDDTMNLGGIKVGCAEIERVLNRLPGVHETAAVAVSPPAGGPSRLVVFVVPAPDAVSPVAEEFQSRMQQAIRSHLNPLFHIDTVRIITALPRTASNKILRRQLRAMCT